MQNEVPEIMKVNKALCFAQLNFIFEQSYKRESLKATGKMRMIMMMMM